MKNRFFDPVLYTDSGHSDRLHLYGAGHLDRNIRLSLRQPVSSTHTVMRISSPFVGHQTVEIFDQFPDGKHGALSLQKRMQRTALREPYLLPILHRAKGIQKNNSRCARLSC